MLPQLYLKEDKNADIKEWLSDNNMDELLNRELTEEEKLKLPSGLLKFWEELLVARLKEEEEKREM